MERNSRRAEERIRELSQNGVCLQLLKDADNILARNKTHKTPFGIKKNVNGKEIEMPLVRITLPLEFIGESCEWEGITSANYESRDDETPRVHRLVFRGLTVQNGTKQISCNPALNFNAITKQASLDFGGLSRDMEGGIIDAIAQNIQSVNDHLENIRRQKATPADTQKRRIFGKLTARFTRTRPEAGTN